MHFGCENRSWPLNSSHSFPELHVEKWENQGCSLFPQWSHWTQERRWANWRSLWDRRFCVSYLRVSFSEQTDFSFCLCLCSKEILQSFFSWLVCLHFSACIKVRCWKRKARLLFCPSPFLFLKTGNSSLVSSIWIFTKIVYFTCKLHR